MSKLKHREVKWLAQDHTASSQQPPNFMPRQCHAWAHALDQFALNRLSSFISSVLIFSSILAFSTKWDGMASKPSLLWVSSKRKREIKHMVKENTEKQRNVWVWSCKKACLLFSSFVFQHTHWGIYLFRKCRWAWLPTRHSRLPPHRNLQADIRDCH